VKYFYFSVSPVEIQNVAPTLERCEEQGYEYVDSLMMGYATPRVAAVGQLPAIPMYLVVIRKEFTDASEVRPPEFNVVPPFQGKN
jgi:hypothetical protein